MNWQETKMDNEQLEWCNAQPEYIASLINQGIQTAIKAQAQITGNIAYKAGVEKVVKWVEENLGYLYLDKHGWQAFKQELRQEE